MYRIVRRGATALAALALLGVGLRAGAQAIPPEFQVNTYTNAYQYDSAVAGLTGGGFIVVWHDSDSTSIAAQIFTGPGAKVGAEFTVPVAGALALTDRGPDVAGLSGGGAVVVWGGAEDNVADVASKPGVAGQVLAANGSKVGGEFHANSYTAGVQRPAGVAALLDGGFVVAWDSAPVAGGTGQDGSGYGVYARRYNANGTPASTAFRVNNTTAGDQKDPAIASLADGGFVVVWLDNGQPGLFARRYDATGSAVGGEFRIKPMGTGFDLDVAGLTTGGFAVAWDEATDGDGLGVFARRFDASGTGLGNPFVVNTYTTSAQWYPAVAPQGGGAFVVAWASDPQDGSSSGVYAQRFTAGGVKDGAEFQVNVQTSGLQSFPAMAAVGSGLAVTWTSDQQDGSSFGVFGRLYGDTGTAIISGTSGPDNLFGTPGNDIIDGKGGADVMTGLAGNDTYIVNNSGDTVVESANEGTDTVRSSVTHTLDANVENLTLIGSANVNGTGNSRVNRIIGNGASNTLNGAAGNDTLTGKGGQDRFLFKNALGSSNVDKITDFNPVADTVRLENAVFTGLPTTGTLAPTAFKLGTAASTAAHRIIYDQATGSVYYDQDGTGATAKVKFATFTTKPTLTNADFVVQ